MPIDFRVPPNDGDWGPHTREVKAARGAVCYGALAAHFGSDSPRILDWRVDRLAPYGKDDDEKDLSGSNKYLRWRQGKSLPHPASIALVSQRSGGSVNLAYWKDLPLWELLTPTAPAIARLNHLLELMPMNIRRHLFVDGAPDRRGQFHHGWPEGDQIRAIRNQASLNALIALLCLARKGEVLEDHPRHYFPSLCAFDLFPRVLYCHRALRYRWEGLFACIERLFWNRIYTSGYQGVFPIDSVHEGLAALDADPDADLPLQSGKNARRNLESSEALR